MDCECSYYNGGDWLRRSLSSLGYRAARLGGGSNRNDSLRFRHLLHFLSPRRLLQNRRSHRRQAQLHLQRRRSFVSRFAPPPLNLNDSEAFSFDLTPIARSLLRWSESEALRVYSVSESLWSGHWIHHCFLHQHDVSNQPEDSDQIVKNHIFIG